MGVLEISPYRKNLKEYGYYWYRDMSQSGLGSVQVLNGEPKRRLQKLYKTYALQESMYFFFPQRMINFQIDTIQIFLFEE